MSVRYISSATPESIQRAAAEVGVGSGQLVGVMIAERGAPALEDVVAALRDLDAAFFGGLFPGLIFGDEQRQEGALIVALPSEHEPVLVTGLESVHFKLPKMEPVAASPPGSHTAVVLVDGLTANVARLLADLQGRLGNCVNYIGGGAGSLSLKQQPCVFTREGVFQDAAVIAFVEQRCRLGVHHGWQHIDGPIVATRTNGNVIEELNWKTAADVYLETIATFSHAPLTRAQLPEVMSSYPFGIYKEGQEDVVRDPVAVGEDGQLTCVGEVPENAVLNILCGNDGSLLAAAAQAAEDSCAGEAVRAHSGLIVDCVSRSLYLAERFDDELGVVHDRFCELAPTLPVWGMLSLGEISSFGHDFLEFFNKTIVTAVLHE